jgi:hypothetical protein
MLVHAHDRAIDHGVFEIGIAGQSFKDPIEDVLRRPSTEPLENGIPMAIGFR